MNTDEIINGLQYTIIDPKATKAATEYIIASRARIAELEAENEQLATKRGCEKSIKALKQLAINSHDEVKKLRADLSALQSHDKEAMELVEAAQKDVVSFQKTIQEITRTAPIGGEHKCIACNEKYCEFCGYGDCWTWQYADRHEALKAPSNETNGGNTLDGNSLQSIS